MAEREAKDKESVKRDEADDEGRHFTRQQGQEAGRSAGGTVAPRDIILQVSTQVQAVCHSDNGLVETHKKKIRNIQVGHEHV